MISANIQGELAIAAGVFTVVAAACDWDWFMQGRKAKFFVDYLGRDGARVFYGVLGIAIILLGLSLCDFRR